MRPIQETKILPAILPGPIVDNAAFTSQVIDLNDIEGAGYLEFLGQLGSIDTAMTTLKVMESDTKSDATTLGGVPTLVKDATAKPGAADDNQPFVFGVDLRSPRQRYIQLQATAGNGAAGTFLTALAIARPGRLSSVAAVRNLLFAEYV